MSCQEPQEVTFTEHIAPIIYTNCTPCHSPGGGGPFPMIDYKDVAKRSKMVAHVTKIRYMPPWPADPHYAEFANQKRITDEEIELIQLWHKAGAPLGDTSLLPKRTEVVSNITKTPDLVVKLKPVQIRGNHRDRFYVMKVPVEIPENKYVRMVEFIPGQPNIVHHVNGHLLNYADDYPINIFEGETLADIESNSFETEFEALNLYTKNEALPSRIHSAVNYLPGARGVFYPNGIGGFQINKRSVFVLKDIHYGPSDIDTLDESEIHLYFSEKAPLRPIKETMLGTNGISPIVPPLVVPPNQIKTFRTQAFISEDISILTINPHMHLLGKSLKAFAVKPNGDTIPLIHIPKWDFRWQYFYTYKTMLKIPRGSTIYVDATFDNTSDNPNNPNKPPIAVGERLTLGGASMRTTDEMLQFIISYLPYQIGDEKISLE